MAREREFEKRQHSGPITAEASGQQLSETELKTDGAQRGGGPTLDATKHEGETGSPTDTRSEEDSSSSEESSCSEETTPPTKALSTTSTKERAPLLGDITKPPVKMINVPNPYLKTRAGIGKFVVPKASILHRPPTQRVWAMTTPSQRTPPVIMRYKGAASLAINKGGDSHIVREKSGRIYNPASEAMQGPPQITTEAGADLKGHRLTPCDLKLRSVYGDHVHRNDGTHLAGGISDDAL